MSTDDINQLLKSTTERSLRYLASLDGRRVSPAPQAVAALRGFDIPLQRDPLRAEDVLQELDALGSPATMAMAGPRFFGFVIGASLPAALAANWLASAWDQNTGLYNSTPGTSHIEQVALTWLLDVLDLPRECAGAFVTGTTVAHITSLAAARHAVLARVGWNVEADGLFGAPPITVITSAEAHPTLFKALGVVGLGRNRVVKIPTDSQGRARADKMPRISGPTIVCLQAGNVNTGAFDPIATIAPAARDAGAWVHIDGAFGLWARVAPTRAHLAESVEHADSWATDAHKWLNVPYDSGVAFVRDGDALRKSMAISAEYLPTQSPNRNPSDFTPELSRRARGVDVWAAMRALGRSGLEEMVERHCRQARMFAAKLSAAGFDILNEVVLNQVLVSFGTPEETRRVIAGVQEEGTCWAGETVWQGKTAMRISVISWATTDADVDRSVQAMIKVARTTRSELSVSRTS
ncbi:MAG TPA: aminotransferase class V-fold PLP-dependent enzyme [Gemmatimonadaceae bacterium]|nr:aminotransferase class V-fold PLP-dependent enzyme [Gemmatimonadaceae bacterium]